MISPTGQGRPLPDFLKCDGEWIVEGFLYLYSDANHSQAGLAPRFTVGASRHDGQPCIGFDAAQIGAGFGIDGMDVRDANRSGALIFLGVADTAPTRGGLKARMYGFQLGEKRISLTVEHSHAEGSA